MLMRSHFKSTVGTFVAGALHGCMSSVNISAPFRASLPRAILRRHAAPRPRPQKERGESHLVAPPFLEPPREAPLRSPSV